LGGDVVPGLSIRPAGRVFYLAGEFDLAGVDVFDRATTAALTGPEPVVLDLTDLMFMDASGLHAVIRLATCVRGRDFVLRNPRPAVMRLLNIMGVAGLPHVHIEIQDGGKR
jgi:anti-anti-sigma factor